MAAELLLLVLLCFGVSCARAHDDQRYTFQEQIPLFIDTVVPEANPSEVYPYLSLGFCPPPEIKHKAPTLADALQGSRKIYSAYDVRFGANAPLFELCHRTLEATEVNAFIYAISNRYHYTMHIDEIPLRGFVGEVDASRNHYLYTSLRFQLSFNQDRIIEAHVAPVPESKQLLIPGVAVPVTFSYTVNWHETGVAFEDRSSNNAVELYSDEVEIQWRSIVTSIGVAVVLTVILVFSMGKVIRGDLLGVGALEDEKEESGWRRLHGDVFRFPKYRTLLCAILGCGVQITIIFISMLTLAVLGVFNPYGRGMTFAAIVVIYAVTAFVAGFVSASMYKMLGGTMWVNSVLATNGLFIIPVFVIWSLLNTVSIIAESTAALPFGTIMGLVMAYVIITFPLSLAGAITGRHYATDFGAPTRTKVAPREIPEVPWFRGPAAFLVFAGAVPILSVYPELFYVFISIWGHQMFAPFGILYLVFIVLIMVTSTLTVSITLLRLRNENHQWWWMSIISGGACSVFVFLYGLHFLATDSDMHGFFQLSHFFGYTFLLCYAIFLMLGTISFYASLAFVRQIYKGIKTE